MSCRMLRTHQPWLWVALVLSVLAAVSCNSRNGSGGSRDSGCDADECMVTRGDNEFGTGFAASMKISGDRLAVGAPDDNGSAINAGAVFVYERDGDDWELVQTLRADDAEAFDRFGGSVSLSGDVLIVGARGHDDTADDDAGAAYVFRHDGTRFVQEERIVPAPRVAGQAFGQSVSISGTTAVVGAPLDGDLGAGAGAVYVFGDTGGTWPEDQKITASDGAAGDFFGTAVATDGTSISVGAPGNDFNPPEFDPTPDPNPGQDFPAINSQRNAGTGYVYRWDGADFDDEVQVFGRREPFDCEIVNYDLLLSGEDSVPHVWTEGAFGSSTDIDGDLVAFGSPFVETRDEALGCNSRRKRDGVGSGFVYRWDGTSNWIFETRMLFSNESDANSNHGMSVAVVDGAVERAVAGVPGDRLFGSQAGTALVYEFDALAGEWELVERLRSSGGRPFDRFGTSATTQVDAVVVGTPTDSQAGTNSGAAYVYAQ